MKRLAYTSILVALLASTATVQAQAPQRQATGPAARISTSLPANSVTVTHWYKQNVYDPGDNKIGEIMDVLVDRDGKITALRRGPLDQKWIDQNVEPLLRSRSPSCSRCSRWPLRPPPRSRAPR